MRPGFIQPTPVRPESFVKPLSEAIPKRVGRGNYHFTRRGFVASDPRPRDGGRSAAARVTSLEERRKEVNLSSKSLSELFNVRVPDPTDTAWLKARKERLDDLMAVKDGVPGLTKAEAERELKNWLPLGREQRHTQKKVNASEAALSTGQKINELGEEISGFRNVSSQQSDEIKNQLLRVLADTERISEMNQTEMADLAKILDTVRSARNFEEAGFPRIVGYEFYTSTVNGKTMEGDINLLLMKTFKDVQYTETLGLSTKKPVLGINGGAVVLQTLKSNLNTGNYLDLLYHQILVPDEAFLVVNKLLESGVPGAADGVDPEKLKFNQLKIRLQKLEIEVSSTKNELTEAKTLESQTLLELDDTLEVAETLYRTVDIETYTKIKEIKEGENPNSKANTKLIKEQNSIFKKAKKALERSHTIHDKGVLASSAPVKALETKMKNLEEQVKQVEAEIANLQNPGGSAAEADLDSLE